MPIQRIACHLPQPPIRSFIEVSTAPFLLEDGGLFHRRQYTSPNYKDTNQDDETAERNAMRMNDKMQLLSASRWPSPVRTYF